MEIQQDHSTVSQISWSDLYSIGHPQMDGQHYKIINVINELSTNKNDIEKVQILINRLIDYGKTHLVDEENLLYLIEFPELTDHEKLHDQYIRMISDVASDLRSLKAADVDRLISFLKDWWQNHILREDMKYKPYLPKSGDLATGTEYKTRLLIVDDEINILNALKRTCSRQDYVIYTAEDGYSALEILKDNVIDLIISDMKMPKMDGGEFLQTCHKLYPDVPRIALSGYSDTEAIINAINNGHIYAFMSKPWDPEDLSLKVKNALELRFLKKSLHRLRREKSRDMELLVLERTSDLIRSNLVQEKIASEESALNHLLKLGISEKNLQNFLDKSIGLLIEQVPWLALLPKGGIFLKEREPGSKKLNLVSTYNFAPELHTLCKQIDFGHCLCGRAAEEKKIQFADCVDERHDVRFDSMAEHGHYNIPILDGNNVLGVISLYLPHGHRQSDQEMRFLERVADVFSISIRKHYSINDLKIAREQADTDGMTQLYNRSYMDRYLENEWNRHNRNHQSLSLLMIDVDFFKQYNDMYGHDMGDECLINIARLLKGCAKRSSDIAARYGGEEFCIILPDTDLQSAQIVAKALSDQVKQLAIPHQGSEVNDIVTLSIGVCSAIPQHYNQSELLLKQADKALYKAKHSGRDKTIGVELRNL